MYCLETIVNPLSEQVGISWNNQQRCELFPVHIVLIIPKQNFRSNDKFCSKDAQIKCCLLFGMLYFLSFLETRNLN